MFAGEIEDGDRDFFDRSVLMAGEFHEIVCDFRGVNLLTATAAHFGGDVIDQ